jgi:ABC-type dipeptide/oligopeptide/nickel transport system permease component
MLRFLLIRLGRAALTIALVVTFAFVVLRLSGDPALIIMSVDAPPEAIAASPPSPRASSACRCAAADPPSTSSPSASPRRWR